MNSTFLETKSFDSTREEYLDDERYMILQRMLMVNPEIGKVMPGCGGIRKVRIADAQRGKGKRGSARVIYLYVPEAFRFLMMTVYGKDMMDDLSKEQKDHLKQLARLFKQKSISQYQQWLKDNML
jgi:hypothetical protein